LTPAELTRPSQRWLAFGYGKKKKTRFRDCRCQLNVLQLCRPVTKDQGLTTNKKSRKKRKKALTNSKGPIKIGAVFNSRMRKFRFSESFRGSKRQHQKESAEEAHELLSFPHQNLSLETLLFHAPGHGQTCLRGVSRSSGIVFSIGP
jgi:hypothetical protein